MATLLNPDLLAESAQRNFGVYGFFGVSVFAETAEVGWTDLAATRFGWRPTRTTRPEGDPTDLGGVDLVEGLTSGPGGGGCTGGDSPA